MDPTMQSPVRITVPFSNGTQVEVPSGPHTYQTKRWVGSVSAGLTPQRAFESLLWNATPFQTEKSVNGGTVKIPGLGSVRQLVDPDRLTVVNTTEPGHILHPGNVFRSIVQEGPDLYVVTQGYGTGMLPRQNEEGAPWAWGYPDFKIRFELNNQGPLGYPMDEMNAVSGTSDPPLGLGQSASAVQQADRPELRVSPPIFFPPY
ncbi:hypothetical protein [Bradyrhizobium sp.]|uniref:hypothetical protein n=1 Tax=Bradyrhizobium sp. TaxID=376 RepID=UPI001EC94DB1|nr:hypothetical protein [Bradyrhizobium sp.]MBV9984648.1 hypothetical protein [Bradyrhizobium sp.]